MRTKIRQVNSGVSGKAKCIGATKETITNTIGSSFCLKQLKARRNITKSAK